MNLKTVELLPPETRALLKEEMRRKLFSDKKRIVEKLGISSTQVFNWKIGKNNPSIAQLKKLGISLAEIWESVESLNLERGKCKITLPKEISIEDCSWLIGVNEGDGVNKNRVIGLTNQNKQLIKRFITETNKFGISNKDLRMVVKANEFGDIDKSQVSKEFGIEERRIELRETTSKTNKPIFQVFTPSRLIKRMFDKVMESMKIANSIKLTGFVQGFFDAEGCVTSGSVKITQKDINGGRRTMEFIRTILNSLDIKQSFLVDKESVITLRLSGGKENLGNLKRFRELIGFSQPEKLEKLNMLISGFEERFPGPNT